MSKLEESKVVQQLTGVYENLITIIGEDPEREGLKKTPMRAAKVFEFLTHGYHIDLDSIIKDAFFTSDNDEMVVVKDIEFSSICEHHLLPIIGRCHVAYLPNGKLIGLSKIPRIVDMFAWRLQIQETLTMQIAECVMKVTGAFGVGVVVEAEHMCITTRGVEKKNVKVKTSSMLGAFRDSAKTRQEFLSLLG